MDEIINLIKSLNQTPRDLIDHYLIEMDSAKEPTSSFYKENGGAINTLNFNANWIISQM